MPHYYQAFDVHPNDLKKAIDGVRALGIFGLNVTIPHKVAVMEWLDEVDEEARLIGAVNTIANKDGRLVGSNTDGQGYLRSLLSLLDTPLKDKTVLVIGAGGAARAIVTSLALHGVKRMDIANRTLEKADKLADHAGKFVPASSLELKEAEETLSRYDVIVNTTSVGMSPNVDAIPLSLQRLQIGTVVSDLIYNPLKTLWLKKAEEKGAIIDNGVAMFVHQGALSFQRWTGKLPNIERMKQTVVNALKEDRQLDKNEK